MKHYPTKDGYAVFYQFDIRGRCRAGKIIPNNPRTGHRIKDGSVPAAMWVHSRLKALHQIPEDYTLSQCLFEQHLPLCPELPVALVEAEKASVICSAFFPEFLWLTTGGLGQFNDRVKVLLGRQAIAFPDLDACDRWRKKAKGYPLLDITVSDYLVKNCPAAAGDGRRSGGLGGGEDGGRGTKFRAVYVVMKFEYSLTFPLKISLLTILLP